MILVLFYRFSEFEDSILGYRFCQKLVREGHDLVVTTTTSVNQGLQEEIEASKRMKEKWGKSVTLIQPEYEEFEEPEHGWIDRHYKTYFGHLKELTHIDAIVGLLPGTTKTAIDLKKVLKIRKLALLATSKIDEDLSDLRADIWSLSDYELLSVGPDIYEHFDILLQNRGKKLDEHKQIFLKPDEEICYKKKVWKFVSVWNRGYSFLYKGKRLQSAGSKAKNFETVGQALKLVNHKYKTLTSGQIIKSSMLWHVYGLSDAEFQNLKGQKIRLVQQERPAWVEEIEFHDSLVFIVPDEKEVTFNFTALAAIWQGVPTLIPKGSSVGKLLLRFPCSLIDHCLVDLKGDSEKDESTWVQKIEREILHSYMNPTEWARQLSQYLRHMTALWHSDFDLSKQSFQGTLKRTWIPSESADGRNPTLMTEELNPTSDVDIIITKVFIQ